MKTNELFNIETCNMPQNEKILIDTNIWYWMTYPNASQERGFNEEKVNQYVDFINKVKDTNKLYVSVINYSELINIVERNEYNLYKKVNSLSNLSRKNFRRLETEKERVQRMIFNMLEQIKKTCSADFIQILDYIEIEKLKQEMISTYLDANDAINLLLARENEILNVLSDDTDFKDASHINLYTYKDNI